MNKGKVITYGLSLSFLAILLSCFFLVKANNAHYLAVILPIFALLITYLIKGRSTLSIYSRQVLLILTVMALLFTMLYYLTGLYFGFYRLPARTFVNILRKALPIVVVITCIEIVRKKLFGINNRWIKVIAFIALVVADVTLTNNFNAFTSFNKFMDFVGLSLFPAIVCNLLFSYVIVRYGALPNIVYRLIILLLPTFITYAPAISGVLYSLMQLLFPILIYLFIKLLYEKKKREKKRVSKKVGITIICLFVVFFSAIIMLISCQFHFCAIVIATESMTGELNKGDVIVYEKYDASSDVISESQIIVFEKYGTRTVHRVVKIEYYNGQTRYYTKGDANDDLDDGFITDQDIYGFVHFKVPGVGYPTLWLRALFK